MQALSFVKEPTTDARVDPRTGETLSDHRTQSHWRKQSLHTQGMQALCHAFSPVIPHGWGRLAVLVSSLGRMARNLGKQIPCAPFMAYLLGSRFSRVLSTCMALASPDSSCQTTFTVVLPEASSP